MMIELSIDRVSLLHSLVASLSHTTQHDHTHTWLTIAPRVSCSSACCFAWPVYHYHCYHHHYRPPAPYHPVLTPKPPSMQLPCWQHATCRRAIRLVRPTSRLATRAPCTSNPSNLVNDNAVPSSITLMLPNGTKARARRLPTSESHRLPTTRTSSCERARTNHRCDALPPLPCLLYVLIVV